MSESVSPPDESRGEKRTFGKHKWRGKLFPAESKFGRAPRNLDNANEDVANFLHTNRPRAGSQLEPLAPRIDVAADLRRPSSALGDPNDTVVDAYRRPKPRQNKGLCVRFESAPTVIIGIGGDEAELPPKDVRSSFTDSVRSKRPPNQDLPHYNSNEQCSKTLGPSTDPYEETSFRPSHLKRRPTGMDVELLAEESPHAGHDQEVLQSASLGSQTLPLRPRNQMQHLDPYLLGEDFRHLTHSSSDGQGYPWHAAETTGHGPTRHLAAPAPRSLPTNSLTTHEPPEPADVSQEASSASYNFIPAIENVPKPTNSEPHCIGQDPRDDPQGPRCKPPSLPAVSVSVGDESLNDFDSRVRRFRDLFRLNASAHVDVMGVSFERWLMVSAWWFLRGRGGLESAMSVKASANAPAKAASDSGVSIVLQAYVNLAKAWWVLKDVIPNLPEMKRLGNAKMNDSIAVLRKFEDRSLVELVEVHSSIISNFRALTMSMKRNGMLPPDDLQLQGLEPQVFLRTPNVPLNIAALMMNNIVTSPIKGRNFVVDPFFPVLVGDTNRHFGFINMFVDILWDPRDDAKSGIPCVVSVLRERTDWAVKTTITSQDGHINLVIHSGEHGGLHWHDVQWKISLHTMQLGLAEGIHLQIKFSKKDFKTIWGICDYTQRVRKEYSARRDEEIVYECKLPMFQCIDSPSFPVEPMRDCRVRLFERKVSGIERNSQHRLHDGYRLAVISPPGTKTINKVNHELGKDCPILFSTDQSRAGTTLVVSVPSSLRAFLTFHEKSDAEFFRSTLAGTLTTKNEHCSAPLHLHGFDISPVSADQNMDASRCISDLGFHKLYVINNGPSTYGHDPQSTTYCESLRIITECDSGTFVDRINSEPGELQLSLSTENLNEIKLLRPAQQSTTWSFADALLQDFNLTSLSQTLQSLRTSPSIRTYHFRSLFDLHTFQTTLTGFHVLYDGLASTFSILRGRMHKRWEASLPRLQIVKQQNNSMMVQLVAFFRDFSHGKCMNFVLKVTDSFDTFARSGTFSLRIVDAKFALPEVGEEDPAGGFVCLDMPEFPGEHDDIVIGFENEHGESVFESAVLFGYDHNLWIPLTD